MRVSYDVRANFKQFYFVRHSCERLTTVLFMSHICRIVRKLPCDVFANVCKGLATGLRRVRNICDDLATVLL